MPKPYRSDGKKTSSSSWNEYNTPMSGGDQVRASRERSVQSVEDKRDFDTRRQSIKSETTKNQIIKGQNSQTAAATAKERLDKQRRDRAKLQASTSALDARKNSLARKNSMKRGSRS